MTIGRHPQRALAVAAVLCAMACTAQAARADVGEQIIRRCTHGQSLRGFSQAAYGRALKEMSAGTEEYSNCGQLIRQAQLEAAGASLGSGAASGAAAIAATPREHAAIAQATRTGAAPVRVDGATIHPGVVPVNVASAFSALPAPLYATVAFLTLCLLLVAGAAIRKRVRARREGGT
jgi:hypothetical protein